MQISQCKFTDIYLSTRDIQTAMVRDLSVKSGEGHWLPKPGPSVIPEDLMDDVKKLFARVIKYHTTSRLDEFMLIYDNARYRCAKITAPEAFGAQKTDQTQNWCLRKINEGVMPFETLGLSAFIRRQMNTYAHRRGLVLVCGSFGSGKTTTASSLFDHWVTTQKEIGVTLEDPPEVSLEKMGPNGTIFQIDLTENSPEEAIRKLRRWNARYVFLGEIRTAEAAQELLQISQSGPLVISTIHASAPVSAITALVRFASARMSENDSRDLIARTLQGVIYQSLEGGKFHTRYLSVGEKDDFSVRTKIRLGDFHRIDEVLEQQEKNRPS